MMQKEIEIVLSREKIETLINILTSEYWLIVSLCGAFFSFFALNRGGVVVFIDACFVFLLVNIISGKYRANDIPVSYWVVLAICAYLLGISVLFNSEASHYRWMSFMVRMLCIVFAIHCLSLKKIEGWVKIFFSAVVSLAVCWQAVAHYIFKMEYGTFSNPHYLSNITMLLFPVIAYSFLSATGWSNLFF